MNIFAFRPFRLGRQKMSDQTVDRLKKFRGENTVRWLVSKSENEVIDYMMKHHGVLPTFDKTATIEDLERRETDDSQVYDPFVQMPTAAATDEVVNADRQKPKEGHRLVKLIECLFNAFARSARQFNSTNTDRALRVSIYLPEYKFQQQSSDIYTPEAPIDIATGHLSTVRWGFLAQVHDTSLAIYAVVPEQLLNFTLHDIRSAGYEPFLTLDAVDMNGQLVWQRNGQVVGSGEVDALADKLVAHLVALSAGKLQPEQLSTL